MNYRNIFENLKTVRDFKHNRISEKVILEIKEYGGKIKNPFGSSLEIVAFDGEEGYKSLNGKIGYFGKLIEAPMYLAVVGAKGSSLVDAGYFTESLRLKIQELGLGSCWISLQDNTPVSEFIGGRNVVSIIAIGEIYNGIFKKDIQVKAERNAVSDIVYNKLWGNEITWEELNAQGLDEVFYFARFAPSWGNKQPWKFIVDSEKIYLLIEKEEKSFFELETGIISLFFEKACIAAGVTVLANYEVSGVDLNQPENYEIKGIFTF